MNIKIGDTVKFRHNEPTDDDQPLKEWVVANIWIEDDMIVISDKNQKNLCWFFLSTNDMPEHQLLKISS